MTPQEWFLAFGMLTTGSVNTLSTAWADRTSAEGRHPENGEYKFDHPFFQAAGMFIGELTCLIAFYVRLRQLRGEKDEDGNDKLQEDEKPENQKWSPTIFMIPAACDMTGTSLMYVGLTMTSASIFQMLRGSVVIFTGVLSVIFLKRKLAKFHWFSMFLVLVGVAIVGMATMLVSSDDDSHSTGEQMLGNGIIICAQMITAVQMVVEEKFVSGQNVPALQAVGWEGCWGLCFITVVLVVMYFIPDNSHKTDKFEDSIDAFYQVGNSWKIALATCGNVFSIAFFNFFGISVTKVMSAAHRMVIDSVRTFVIWGVSLALGCEDF
jgi:drug/metabolite transporter (DMT)-like permease